MSSAALSARRRRIRTIRARVAAIAVSIFLAAFATVFVRLATGHDPALASKPAAAKASAAATGTASSSSSTSSSSSGAATPSTSAPAAVTTQQS